MAAPFLRSQPALVQTLLSHAFVVERTGLSLNMADDGGHALHFLRQTCFQKVLQSVEDIKLPLRGDVRRFQEARAPAVRLISRKDDIGSGEGTYCEHEEQDYDRYMDD